MENTEAIIDSTLQSLRERLSEILAARNPPFSMSRDIEPPEAYEVLEAIRLEAQIKALEQLRETLEKHHSETKAQFLAIEKRDEHSSKEGIWLTVISSAISLILGWLLSLLGSPATLMHALGR